MAKNKFNKQWLQDHLKDPYVKMAQKEGYRARAAYKLKEMDEAEKLIRPGMLVVDLGSAPGSWSQYLRNKLLDKGELRGRIIAMDILPMEAVPNVIFLQGDFREDEVLRQLDALVGEDKVDLVVSDMAPNLSGVESADMARIAHVCELAMEFAQTHLKPEGALLVKAFHGSGYSQIVESFKRVFRVVKPLKPKASRDKSSETFRLG
ncbi:MAG: RlmE family RNA methyltransferase, partial [Burkholderiales bacterium]